jgi:hypothetical protein
MEGPAKEKIVPSLTIFFPPVNIQGKEKLYLLYKSRFKLKIPGLLRFLPLPSPSTHTSHVAVLQLHLNLNSPIFLLNGLSILPKIDYKWIYSYCVMLWTVRAKISCFN